MSEQKTQSGDCRRHLREEENKAGLQRKRKTLRQGHNFLSVPGLSVLIPFLIYGDP